MKVFGTMMVILMSLPAVSMAQWNLKMHAGSTVANSDDIVIGTNGSLISNGGLIIGRVHVYYVSPLRKSIASQKEIELQFDGGTAHVVGIRQLDDDRLITFDDATEAFILKSLAGAHTMTIQYATFHEVFKNTISLKGSAKALDQFARIKLPSK